MEVATHFEPQVQEGASSRLRSQQAYKGSENLYLYLLALVTKGGAAELFFALNRERQTSKTNVVLIGASPADLSGVPAHCHPLHRICQPSSRVCVCNAHCPCTH